MLAKVGCCPFVEAVSISCVLSGATTAILPAVALCPSPCVLASRDEKKELFAGRARCYVRDGPCTPVRTLSRRPAPVYQGSGSLLPFAFFTTEPPEYS